MMTVPSDMLNLVIRRPAAIEEIDMYKEKGIRR